MTASKQSSGISRVRQKTLERRRQLVALSTRGIFEQGYDKFSVNDLAAAAGLSVGGIYRYISTKSDLLVMACEDIYGGLYEALVQAVREITGSEQQLRTAFVLYLASCEAAKDQVLLLYREYQHLPREDQRRYKDRESRIADLFAQIITAGQCSGEFDGADAQTVAQDMVLLGHLPALKSWTLGERVGQRLAREQMDFVIAGLTPNRKKKPAQEPSHLSAASRTATEPEGTP